MTSPLLDKSVKILLLLFLFFAILYFAKPFLVLILIGVFLAMLLMPLCLWLEKKLPRPLAAVLSVLAFLLVTALVVYILGRQVASIAANADEIKQNLTAKLHEVEGFVSKTFGISQQKQQQAIARQQPSTSSISGLITGFFASLGGLLTNYIILLVYIFLFLYFRRHFREFVIRVVPASEKEPAKTIMHDVQRVAQQYLTGLALMIACLWVMYGIGFSLIGIRSPIFYALLCGMLELVPFVGNLTGVSITVVMSLAQGGDLKTVLLVLLTYGIVQFVQSYVLAPMVVGKSISIHPVFTIVGLVGAELLWGIPGMALVMPVMGVTKIIFDHIEPLKPYGYLIGEEKTGKPGLMDKIKKKVAD